MEDKKAHDLAVVITKGIMGKDFREQTEEKPNHLGKWQWIGPNYGDRSKGQIWATCSICNRRVCIKVDDMGCCPNCHAEMDVENKEYAYMLEWNDLYSERGFNSIADALKGAADDMGSKLIAGSIVIVGEVEEAGIGIDADSLLEDIGTRAYSEFGECAEDYLTDVTIEHQSILEDELNAVFNKWAEKYNYRPHFYTVKNEKPYVYDGEKWVLKNECKNCDR